MMTKCYPSNMPYNSSVSRLSKYLDMIIWGILEYSGVYGDILLWKRLLDLLYYFQISFNINRFLDFSMLKVKHGEAWSKFQTSLYYKETNKLSLVVKMNAVNCFLVFRSV